MSGLSIDRLALNQGWAGEVADWHRELAKLIAPMAVAGIFREARVVRDSTSVFITFTDTFKYRQARFHLEALQKVFGFKPVLQVLTVDRKENREKGV